MVFLPTFTGAFVYWLHQFDNQGCTSPLLVLQCRPLWVPITTLTGVITNNSSYAFMFGHCPIYLHSKRSAQGPAHILLYGMDVATAVFLTPKYRYRGLGGLFTRLLRWDGSQQCQHHHFPNECHHRCEFFLGAEQVVSLGVEKEKQGVPRSKDENEDEDDECNQCFELSKSCFLLWEFGYCLATFIYFFSVSTVCRAAVVAAERNGCVTWYLFFWRVAFHRLWKSGGAFTWTSRWKLVKG